MSNLINKIAKQISVSKKEVSSNLKKYINYVSIQENQLSKFEDKKEQFKNDFYNDTQENIIFKKHKVKKNSNTNDKTS